MFLEQEKEKPEKPENQEGHLEKIFQKETVERKQKKVAREPKLR